MDFNTPENVTSSVNLPAVIIFPTLNLGMLTVLPNNFVAIFVTLTKPTFVEILTRVVAA
ncbi:hypothetical protein PFDG_00200 [Plasmodium falciparum Dd2]|uniref:Uncharacterized protein n=1 Tax=Plasmodium falciparum (isolate Dd2) TaxID=57267 RepID=A0A0L7LW63_PLAF4|nr:hypothetical protein PFDG_00200 [Plasmodium falciparum Dd2]